ncbi:MAG: hypothetical protein ACI8W7_003426, partial [Gammaproteobacteria bacterium]
RQVPIKVNKRSVAPCRQSDGCGMEFSRVHANTRVMIRQAMAPEAMTLEEMVPEKMAPERWRRKDGAEKMAPKK